jgi:hypothetical protein
MEPWVGRPATGSCGDLLADLRAQSASDLLDLGGHQLDLW